MQLLMDCYPWIQLQRGGGKLQIVPSYSPFPYSLTCYSTVPSHQNAPSSFGNRILFTCYAATVFVLSLSVAAPSLLQVWLFFSSHLWF